MANFTNNPIQSGTTSATSQYMATNTKDYSKFGYWLTGIDVTSQNLGDFTQYVPGYGRIFWYRMPYFMEKYFPELTKRFKSYFETGYKSIDGIGDITAEFEDYSGGFNAQTYSNIASVKDDTNEISVVMYELSGSPVREFMTTWLTGVRDPRTNVATYHGNVNDPSTGNVGIEYGEENHTGELIYYTADPTMKKIEYACLFAHVMGTVVPRSHLNFSSGDNSATEVTLSFRCTKYESRFVNDVAAYYMALDTLKYSYLDFNPNITQEQVAKANTTFGG